MSRLMSVALTEQAVVERRKTVTRRQGWLFAKPGDRVTLCRKVMGRQGAPLVRLAEVELINVRFEPAGAVTDDDVAREGFPDWSREQFLDLLRDSLGIYGDDMVTRIEWRYIDPKPAGATGGEPDA